VEDSPDDKAQSNVTDPELHIMRTTNKGWEYCGNAQASVDGAWQIILACDVTEASHDKQQAEPLAQATLMTLTQAGLERQIDGQFRGQFFVIGINAQRGLRQIAKLSQGQAGIPPGADDRLACHHCSWSISRGGAGLAHY